MTHDPLCEEVLYRCICGQLDRARADERERIATAIEARVEDGAGRHSFWRLGHTTGIREAARIARNGTAGGTSVEPDTGPEPEPGITPPQMRMVGALIGRWEARAETRLDRDARRALIATMAGLDPADLGSAKDLTMAQASTAIGNLQADLGQDGGGDA